MRPNAERISDESPPPPEKRFLLAERANERTWNDEQSVKLKAERGATPKREENRPRRTTNCQIVMQRCLCVHWGLV